MSHLTLVPTGPIILTEAEFDERFMPHKNHLGGNGSWDGCMYETFGEEDAYVRQVAENTPLVVWTQVSDDDGELVVVNGWHSVNRMGHLICAVPYGPDDDFLVDDNECFYCDRARDTCIANPCEDRRAELEDDGDEIPEASDADDSDGDSSDEPTDEEEA
jgi:hypothetical protein